MANLTASTLYADASKWDQHRPDHARILTTIGGAAATSRDVTQKAYLNIAMRSPTAVAFVIAGDEDHIHIGHTMTQFPQDVMDPVGFGDHSLVLVGDSIDGSVPIILPHDMFARLPLAYAKTAAAIVGAAGHGAAPPVFRSGPHAAGDANVNQIRDRKIFLLDPELAVPALTTAPAGRYTMPGFYQTFLMPDLTSGDAPRIAAAEPLRDWFRMASTNTNTGASLLAVAPVATGGPIPTQKLNAWVNRVKTDLKVRQGVGGPGLTTAAFQLGVTSIQSTLEDNAREHLEFERTRNDKTFTDKHGPTLAQRLHRLCNVADDAHLPEVHTLLAKSPKSRDYGILHSLIQERTEASDVPLTLVTAPLATPTLMDEVFRCLNPAGTGLEFGAHLTPFAVVCEGHKEANQLNKLIKAAVVAEGGTSLSLADSERLLSSSDVRFPTSPQIAAEKLYGWSVLIDLFHGSGHAAAGVVRKFVIEVGPALHRLYEQCPEEPAAAMDLVCRVLFEAQQEYFAWVSQTAGKPSGTGPSLNLDDILFKALTFRADSLSRMPALYYRMLDSPAGPRPRVPQPARSPAVPSSPRTTDAHADQGLLTRFRESGHSTISSLMEGHEVNVPKHAGEPVCLTWALKGQCSRLCSRKDQHVRYGRATVQAIGRLLTTCGVANPQV